MNTSPDNLSEKEARRYIAHRNAGELSEQEERVLEAFIENHPELLDDVRQYEKVWERMEVIEQKARAIYPVDEQGGTLRPMEERLERELAECSQPKPGAFDDTSRSRGRTREETGRTRPGVPRRSKAFPWKVAGAAAVLLLLVLTAGYVWWDTGGSDTGTQWIASITRVEGNPEIRRNGRQLSVASGMDVQARDRVSVPVGGTLVVQYPGDGTRITVRERSQLRFEGHRQTRHLRLESGTLDAEVASQTGTSLVVTTPDARAEVIGTRFRVVVDDRTRVEVREGKVRFGARDLTSSVVVEAGEFGEVGGGQSLTSGTFDPRGREERGDETPAKPAEETSSTSTPDQISSKEASFHGWEERFTDLPDGTRADDGDTAWETGETSVPPDGYFGVSRGRFEATNTRRKKVWQSESIDISAAESVRVAVDVSGVGPLNDSGAHKDELHVYVIIDGQKKQIIGTNSGSIENSPMSAGGITGNTVRVHISAKTTGMNADESYFWDNVTVQPE